MNEEIYRIDDYQFEKKDFYFYFKALWKDRGAKAIYQLLNRPLRRNYSRSVIKRVAPFGTGLEIGVGARTIAPVRRTILSDAFSEHGVDDSIAKVFFKGDKIPYSDETFAFLLSEHVLEHIANPILTLKEWIRVLKKGGKIILFLPHKERTNDCHREVTSLNHLIEDYTNDIPFNDGTHFKDWWDNVVEKGLMPEHYRHIAKESLLDSCSIHHHVWTEKEIIEIFEYLKLKVVFSDPKVHDRRDSFLVVGEKV